MEATFRVSVRELAASRWFPPDLTPAGGLADMLAGGRAHRARQAVQAAVFELEKPVRAEIPLGGECVTVFGRMDAFCDGCPPVVEEIKLCRTPPEAALPEHAAQARLYAALWTHTTGAETVETRVVYVQEDGEPLRVFAETLTRTVLQSELESLLTDWLALQVPERDRALVRDQTLQGLVFPFPQYRAGQRELAVQAYTAITRRKRLYASLPTGTGKSAAVLYPALKALGEGKTRKILYLTARNTTRQSPLQALERMRAQGAAIRVSTVLAKEKLCPAPTRCHPDDCPRAKGYYLREPDAVRALLASDGFWTDEVIRTAADAYLLCPFELALTLTGFADVVLMDVNYLFDPFARILRLWKRRRDLTVLIDEAHHLLERVRDSLSGKLDTRELRAWRTLFGKALGRKHPCYARLTALLHALAALEPACAAPETEPAVGMPADPAAVPSAPVPKAALTVTETVAAPSIPPGDDADPMPEPPPPDASGTGSPSGHAAHTRGSRAYRLAEPPVAVLAAAGDLLETVVGLLQTRLPDADSRHAAVEALRRLATFGYAAERFGDAYAALLECHGRECTLELFCLSPAETIAETTHGMRGAVFFSATLSPLDAMRALLGGDEADACFALASPFPPERLAVVRRRAQTRFALREAGAAHVAQSIAEAAAARPGKYIAYFPSYAYLQLVLAHLETLSLPPLCVQEPEMDETARMCFLQRFTEQPGPLLGLCVLGGLFAEGVDLPGDQLIGAMIVGVGLPTPSLRLKTLQGYYAQRFGDGFLYAWMIPAMQKVTQAAGRVIRTERDRGLVLLLDDRYYDPRYLRLLPPEWRITNEAITGAARALDALEE